MTQGAGEGEGRMWWEYRVSAATRVSLYIYIFKKKSKLLTKKAFFFHSLNTQSNFSCILSELRLQPFVVFV